jgi:hypothetical protein
MTDSSGNGRMKYWPKWGERCEEHYDVVIIDCESSQQDATQDTTQDGVPYLCYSTLGCIDAIVSALREIFKLPFGIISSWGLQLDRHRYGIRIYSSHFYTECHLIQLRISQLVYDRCLSTTRQASNCIDSNKLGFSAALHITGHDLRKKLRYDEEQNTFYRASLSTPDEMIGGDNDIHLKSRHCMKSYVFDTDSSYDLNDMLMSHQDVRCFTQRPSLLIGLDFLQDQCRVFTEGSTDSVPPSVKRQWLYEKPNMSMTSFPREVRVDRTNNVHTISRRQLITSHAQTCSRTSSQYSRLRTCSKRSRQCSHLKTCDRRSRQSSRLNTCLDTSDIILPHHFLWSICLFALRICMDALDYGESILNGICWMQYGLWPIMLSCRSYLTDTRIDSWGVLRSCKFLLEACLMRYVRIGSIRMWNLLEVSTRESTTELVWQMTTSKVLSLLANSYLSSSVKP